MAVATVRSSRTQTDFSATGLEPAGAAEGDLLLMNIHNPFSSTAFSPPTGWTEVLDVAGGGGRHGWFWIIRGSSAPSYAIGGGNGSSTAIFTYAITGGTFDATTPMDATPTSATKSGTNPDSPAIEVATDDALILVSTGNDWSSQTLTAPTNFTGIGQTEGANAAYNATGYAIGSQGPFSWTSASQTWVSATLAIRPADGGGGSPAPIYRRARLFLGVGS